MSDDYSYDYKGINEARIFTIILATISTLFSLSVVFILLQQYNSLVRGKTLVHYVLCIAMADTMATIFMGFGYPNIRVACSVQGFCFCLFVRFSWFYTDALIVQFFSIVVFRRYFLTTTYVHCIVWSLNLLLIFLPFTTGVKYGMDDEIETNFIICTMFGGEGKFNNHFWMLYSFDLGIIISFVLIVILSLIIVHFSLRDSTSHSASEAYLAARIKNSWSLVLLYPAALLITWIPSQTYALYFNYMLSTGHRPSGNFWVLFDYLVAWSALYGPLLSIIFYNKTIDARQAWLVNLRYIMCVITKMIWISR